MQYIHGLCTFCPQLQTLIISEPLRSTQEAPASQLVLVVVDVLEVVEVLEVPM